MWTGFMEQWRGESPTPSGGFSKAARWGQWVTLGYGANFSMRVALAECAEGTRGGRGRREWAPVVCEPGRNPDPARLLRGGTPGLGGCGALICALGVRACRLRSRAGVQCCEKRVRCVQVRIPQQISLSLALHLCAHIRPHVPNERRHRRRGEGRRVYRGGSKQVCFGEIAMVWRPGNYSGVHVLYAAGREPPGKPLPPPLRPPRRILHRCARRSSRSRTARGRVQTPAAPGEVPA